MNGFRESIGIVGLFLGLFLGVIIILDITDLSFDSAPTVSNANDEANNESLANLWGSESISSIFDTIGDIMAEIIGSIVPIVI